MVASFPRLRTHIAKETKVSPSPGEPGPSTRRSLLAGAGGAPALLGARGGVHGPAAAFPRPARRRHDPLADLRAQLPAGSRRPELQPRDGPLHGARRTLGSLRPARGGPDPRGRRGARRL